MIFSLRKLLVVIKFISMFIVLTYILFHLIAVISNWIEPANKYREPSGRAVKVFYEDMNLYGEHASVKDRLKFFYWYGE